MIKIKTMIYIIICCLLSGNITTNSTHLVELNDDSTKSTSAHWDLPLNGSFEINILNLSLNDSEEWYDLPTKAPAETNISLEIQFNATGLDLEKSFRLELQLWSTHQNYSLIKHNDIQYYLFDSLSLSGNNGSHSSEHEIQMVDNTTDGDQVRTRIHGCYWVQYSVKDIRDGSNTLPSGTSEKISFGESCPTDDSDFDGWTDSQEILFGSDMNDSNSTPYTIFDEQTLLYNSLLNQYNQLQFEDSDGDSWSDDHEVIFGSFVNDPDSTPLTVLTELSNTLNETNSNLLSCQNGWATTNLSLEHCQSDYTDCIEEWLNANLSLYSCQNELGNTDLDNDGWSNSVELLCGSNSSNAESIPTALDGAICWELADDDLDGVRNIDDSCPSTPTNTEGTNSTGCAVVCVTCSQNDVDADVQQNADDEIDITGGGDIVDLIVIGGGSLIAGIGLTSILNKPGRWDFKKPKLNDKNKETIKDIVEDIDLDLEFDSDNEIETPKVKKEKSSTNVSDQYFKSGVERQKTMTEAADPLLDDYIED